MKKGIYIGVCFFLVLLTSSCRQAAEGKRYVTVVDPSGSAVDVEYTVNDAGGGAFSFISTGDVRQIQDRLEPPLHICDGCSVISLVFIGSRAQILNENSERAT